MVKQQSIELTPGQILSQDLEEMEFLNERMVKGAREGTLSLHEEYFILRALHLFNEEAKQAEIVNWP